MGYYDDLLIETQNAGRLERLEKIELSIANRLRGFYADLPPDYLEFLQEIGSGEMGSGAYIIYNGLLSPNEIYDELRAGALKDILIFGDDMQGYCSGFDFRHGWVVVEIDPSDMSYRKIFDCFSEFVRDKLSEI